MGTDPTPNSPETSLPRSPALSGATFTLFLSDSPTDMGTCCTPESPVPALLATGRTPAPVRCPACRSAAQ